MTEYTPIAHGTPPRNVPIEWIAPSGEVVRGTYAGGAVWFPEGSGMYVYYTPAFWRQVAPHARGERVKSEDRT